MELAEVIISISHKSVDKIFHYLIPDELKDEIKIGMRVNVPFGMRNKMSQGYVVGFSDKTDIEFSKLKYIISLKDKEPIFSKEMIILAKWMKKKYYTTLSECLQCIMPKIINSKIFSYVYININKNNQDLAKECMKKESKQSAVLNLLMQFDGISINEIKTVLQITDSPIKTLEKKGLIEIRSVEKKRDAYNADNIKHSEPPKATEEQKYTIDYIKSKLYSDNKKPILIHGVTGSGKTEIYMNIIKEVLNSGKQAIVLVPEISLTPQTVERFISRFGNLVTVTHSRLSYGERYDQWRKAKSGEISVMIGPRSAIFTPFNNIGVIIIDEEHESSYKSDVTPKYDVREVAEKLCELNKSLLILGSATPSINTYYNTQIGKFDLVSIKKRVNKCFPKIKIIDMCNELACGNKSIFSVDLKNAVKRNLEEKKQTILFLNRRGHSTFVSCRSCGFVMKCDDCNVNYTYHMNSDKLICHYCGKTAVNPKICPQCGSKYIKYFGTGTQKVEESIKKIFPESKVLRMDLDTTSKKNSHADILKQFSNGEADILIGTQMIAKGLDFPNVTLVGIIAADLSLNTGDYRASEVTFQLITQVSGRAGRAEQPGEVFIQTYNPSHYSVMYAKNNDYLGFYNEEIKLRKQMVYPPFSNLFLVMFTGENEKSVISKIFKLSDVMKKYNKNNQFDILGPAPAMISKIKKQYRWKIMVRSIDEESLKNYVVFCINKLEETENFNDINLNISLNPNYIS